MKFDIERFVDAWKWHCQAGGESEEHRRAGEDMLAQMTQDVHYDEAMLHVSWHGHDEIREMYSTAIGWSTNHFHIPTAFSASNGMYTIEWTMQGHGNTENGLIPPHDNNFEFRGVSVGRYNDDGLVYYHADYWDILNWMEMGGSYPPGRSSWFANVGDAMGR